jgi:anti-sigma factor (TIGR02949 family)
MNSCDEYSVKTLRYLDHDLRGLELEDFRTHLEACASCRARLDAEQALSHLLHQSRPLYSVPAALRARVSAAVIHHSAHARAGDRLHQRVWQLLRRRCLGGGRRLSSLRVLAPALLMVALCLSFGPNVVRQVRAANYVETAVAAHRAYLNGTLAAGIRSGSPELVTTWFSGKVPFHFRLPNAESTPESKPSYRLTGAGLVSYKGHPAALVTYQTRDEKISLLIASNETAAIAGGDEVHSGSLTFHYHRNSNFKVITWSNHGLSYALVSSVSGSASSSCLVCHQNMSDHNAFSARR